MRVRLKGLNSRRKVLADGTVKRYWYAWKGGPPLTGKPGSPEFVASYNEAVSTRLQPSTKILLSLIEGFQNSANFAALAERTQSDYRKHLLAIERRFGDFPVSALTHRRSRAIFMEWRDELARRSLRQADYAWTVLARCLSWALDRGLIDKNPCERGGRLYSASRVDRVWSDADEAAFKRVASPQLRFAMLVALWTGQRQGDLLRLSWSAYDEFAHPSAAEQDRRPRGHPCRRAAQGGARCDQADIAADADERAWEAMDGGRLPFLMAKGGSESRHRRSDIQ